MPIQIGNFKASDAAPQPVATPEVEQAALVSEAVETLEETIQEENLTQEVRSPRDGKSLTPQPIEVSPVDGGSDGLKEKVKAAASRIERELIVRALDQTSGNVTHAARLLKISRKGLQLKMKELGLREREE